MAAVTLGNTPSRHIWGDLAVRFFQVNGATGSTLATGMSNLLFVTASQSNAGGTISVITAISYNAVTGVVTFTSSGTMVNENIMVIARVG